MNFSLTCLISLIICSCHHETQSYKAIDIHDGDTIRIVEYDCKENCKSTKVRLVGIDTPEIDQQDWGIRARDFVRGEITNKRLYIESGITPIDKYGRTLAYVFYCSGNDLCKKDQAVFLNQKILEHGYAQIYIYPGDSKYSAILKEAEYKARSLNLNIWNADNGLKLSPAKYRARQKRTEK